MTKTDAPRRIDNLSLQNKQVIVRPRDEPWIVLWSAVLFVAGLALTPVLLSIRLDLLGWIALFSVPVVGTVALLRCLLFCVQFEPKTIRYRKWTGQQRQYGYHEIERAREEGGNLEICFIDSSRIRIYGLDGDLDLVRRTLVDHSILVE